MKAKTKKRLIIWACILIVLGTVGFFGYRYALEYLGGYAMKKIISSEINAMLETGEMTVEEVEEIAEEKLPEKEEKQTEEKPSATQKPQKTVTEVVEKAADKVTQGISREDKREIMRLIGARLTREDVNQLMAMAKDGRLSAKEVDAATKIAYARFTSEELKQVKSFWHKYKSMAIKKS